MTHSKYHVHILWDCDESECQHVEFEKDLCELKALLKKWAHESSRIKVYCGFRTEFGPLEGKP